MIQKMTEIPKFPRYRLATNYAYDLLVKLNVQSFPCNLIDLAKSVGVKVKKYSVIAKKSNCTIDDVCEQFRSKRGYIYLNKHGKHFIAYNDCMSKDIIQFTLAHELGHYFLNHLIDFEQTKLTYLSEDEISDEHQVLENEASCFARNFIAPFPIVKKIDKVTNLDVQRLFGIGFKAAQTRLSLLEIDTFNYIPSVQKRLFFDKVISRIESSATCDRCKSIFHHKNAIYCPYCKSTDIWNLGFQITFYREFGGFVDMKYSFIETDDNLNPLACPRCRSEEIKPDNVYCPYCGTFLHNVCLGEEPFGHTMSLKERVEHCSCNDEFLNGGYRYCPDCGCKTSYFEQGLLPDWEKEYNEYPFS